MDREKALALVKVQLTEKRYKHTLGVMETAVELAEKYGADVRKAELAAIFHDYAKFRPKDEMERIIMEQGMDPLLLHFHSELWHAPVGAYLVRTEAGLEDEEILRAIERHTSGKPGMTLLDKVIYVADYIEPGRSFNGVEEVRELARHDLDKAMLQAVKNTISFLLSKGSPIFPDTFHTYNDLITQED